MNKLFLLITLLAVCFLHSQEQNVLLVTWNIKDFGKTKNAEELNRIAEVVKEADILAIQEVVAGYGGAQAVAKLSDILNRKGAQWDYVISNPTNSPKYATERYAFIWKTKNIKIKNRGWLLDELNPNIDREPFLLDFYLNKQKFTVINFHSRPHDKNPESEIEALSNFVMDSLGTPLIIAGDFNVDEKEPVFDPLKSKGYTATITNQKTTLKRTCKRGEYLNYPIDNIFYSIDIKKIDGGVIDFVKLCNRIEQARKISDHIPVFLMFHVERKQQ
ncbi:endonuclease/exonuclease/phosphatase family protein [Flagellimonas myxillae]|uniref:endonuclease/exonuclease/phosphatase family protein n=1 Tax=Flagellimonas myxillae TaxID=2942214 RepID=UPI00201F9498|nr:endonuclease/exonuclease/phosphatase family protein [Muricauda myxillae]MCL6267771.1 endonuclease/exonuclease/phosphatase family protein [Muricauda myxillae]